MKDMFLIFARNKQISKLLKDFVQNLTDPRGRYLYARRAAVQRLPAATDSVDHLRHIMH